MPRVSVIVPARDAAGTLPRTLTALAAQDLDEPYEVIVVDDGSTDATTERAREAPGPVTVVEQPATGPGAARNRGVETASGEVLAFCDADVYPTPRWLREAVTALEHADLVQGRVLPDQEVTLGPFDRTLWVTHEAGLYQSANLVTTRRVFDTVGGFEDWLMPTSGIGMAEDVLFGWGARRAGFTTRFCPAALAHHEVFGRDWRAYAAERRRLRYFPAMARRIPELRREFFYRRAFLNRRTASLDLALCGAFAALIARSPLPLIAAGPYTRMVYGRARGHDAPASRVAAGDIAADLVGLAAMVRGSVEFRSPLA